MKTVNCKLVSAWVVLLLAASLSGKTKKQDKQADEHPLDKSIESISKLQEDERQANQNPGSLWTPGARFVDLAVDLRAHRVGDIVTIQVNENASAVSTGTSKTARTSTLQSNVAQLAGITKATGPLANLAKLNTAQSLDGQGTTSRDTTLTATLSALVTRVLPNGNLVVEGVKNVGVNSENQTISVRGMVRPIDLDTTNSVPSDRIAQMEVRVNGKGIVNDSIHRPFFLYRLLLGILPF